MLEKWGNSIKYSVGESKLNRILEEDILEVNSWEAFADKPSITVTGKNPQNLLVFYPKCAEMEISLRENGLKIQNGPGSPPSQTPVLFVNRERETVDFAFDIIPNEVPTNFPDRYPPEGWKYPLWDYRHPTSFFTFLPLLKVWKVPQLGLSYTYPFEKIDDLFLPLGNFFRIGGLVFLLEKGQGRIKFSRGLYRFSFLNYTQEVARFQWIVPERYKEMCYWIVDGKKTHSFNVPPENRYEKIAVEFYIEGEIREREDFLKTLIVIQSDHRIEWIPFPLFPEKAGAQK